MRARTDLNIRPEYDREIQDIADYVLNYRVVSADAWNTARLCLMDTLGCGLLALRLPECVRLLGPLVEGTVVPQGARVPGTSWRLDPVTAAWNIGCMIRWLDFNDTWLAAEWGHPSDNLGGILAVADHLSQQHGARGEAPLTMQQVLEAMIQAHEIQGVIALENSFNRVGLDHVFLVKLASTAVIAKLRGLDRERTLSALSHAIVDGQALRTYRHAPNTGSRKSWAAGDATARAVRLVELAARGETGIPGALSTPQWGFYDVLFSHRNEDLATKAPADRVFSLARPYGSYVMENVLFKIAFPAEFHGQTACEAAVALHPHVRARLDDISRIVITTQEPALRIIAKEGPLANPADRDHCLQYMVAVALIAGDLAAEHYSDAFHAAHPLIDVLREKMDVVEDGRYTAEYYQPDRRSVANALQVFFRDGSHTEKVAVEFPLGHRRRRAEGIPLLERKFRSSLETRFSAARSERIFSLCRDPQRLAAMPVDEFVDLFVV